MQNPVHIILIDDDSGTNFYHKIIIRESGIEVNVESFFYAQQALDYIAQQPVVSNALGGPTIIFLDINMPGMNGWDFLDEFEKFPDDLKAQYIVIILTTNETIKDRAKAFSNPHVKKFLAKPLKPEALQDVIDTYCTIS